MKIKVENYRGEVNTFASLELYVEIMLDGNDYETDALEAVTNTVCNNSQAIGRLLKLMAEKNWITANEVVQVVEDDNFASATFED